MDQFSFAKQMIGFNKTAFESTYGTMLMVQEQTEKMMNSFIEQADWLPGEGKKALADMMAVYKKGCSEFKKAVDENFSKAEAYFEQAAQK